MAAQGHRAWRRLARRDFERGLGAELPRAPARHERRVHFVGRRGRRTADRLAKLDDAAKALGQRHRPGGLENAAARLQPWRPFRAIPACDLRAAGDVVSLRDVHRDLPVDDPGPVARPGLTGTVAWLDRVSLVLRDVLDSGGDAMDRESRRGPQTVAQAICARL